jgi:hypothetical protein
MTLAQADRRWGSLKLGIGDATIGGAGCVLVSLVEAARFLETRPGLLPPHANEQARQAGCFDGSLIRVHDAAPLFGLSAPLSQRVVTYEEPKATPKDLVATIEGVIGDGGVALLRVQHDKGQHTILCTNLREGAGGLVEMVCTDSAPGTQIILSFPELAGLSVWKKGDVRRYRVIGVRPVRRAAQ